MIICMPYLSDAFDAVLCVAVLHHISTLGKRVYTCLQTLDLHSHLYVCIHACPDRRVAILRELVRICRPGGEILLQAWAQEQEPGSRNFDFESSTTQDVFVPWTLPARFATGAAASSSGTGKEGRSEEGLTAVVREPAVRKIDTLSEEEAAAVRMREDRLRRRRERKRLKALRRRQGQTEGQVSHDGDEQEGADPAEDDESDDAAQTGPEPEKSAAVSSSSKGGGGGAGQVLNRYCHVYRKGELEDLCST